MLLLMNVLTYFIDSSVAFEIFLYSVYRTRMLLPVYTLSNYFDKYNSSIFALHNVAITH